MIEDKRSLDFILMGKKELQQGFKRGRIMSALTKWGEEKGWWWGATRG